MSGRSPKSEVRSWNRAGRWFGLLAWLSAGFAAPAADVASLCADRAAIERVYHSHRTGTKQAFEEVMPRELIERLVRDDARKEATLRKNYAVEITSAMLDAEVARINATTRAPDTLAEIKHALGDDARRFASAMARPILVERELHSRFDNDDKLHAAQRREAEQARASLLAKKPIEGMHDVTWQLTPRPAEEQADLAKRGANAAPAPTKGAANSASYSVEATAQVSQVLAPLNSQPSTLNYFADLDPQLQNVLRAQLQKPGDVSAVIEMPAGFLIFQAKAKTSGALTAATLSIPKRSYEEWLQAMQEQRP